MASDRESVVRRSRYAIRSNNTKLDSMALVALTDGHDMEDYLQGAVNNAHLGCATSDEQWDTHGSGPSTHALTHNRSRSQLLLRKRDGTSKARKVRWRLILARSSASTTKRIA